MAEIRLTSPIGSTTINATPLPDAPHGARTDPARPASAAPDLYAPQNAFPPHRDTHRFLGLDALRGVAVLLILYGHVNFRMPDNTAARPLFFAIRQLGVLGVDIFYVLSGFLVGGALLAEYQSEGRIHLARFFARRALRLWPSYFLVILFAWQWFHHVHLPVADGTIVQGTSFRAMWPYFAHVQNYYNLLQHDMGATAALQTWTLASIVHFYIFAVLLIAVLAAIGPRAVRSIPWIVAALAIMCFIMRLRGAPLTDDDFDAYQHYFPTHLRLDEPMFGLLLAWLIVFHRPRLDRFLSRAWPFVIALSLAATLPLALRIEETPRFLCIWGYTVGALAAGGLTLTLWWLENRPLTNPTAPSLASSRLSYLRPLAFVGLCSYSIYLWHQPLCTHLLEDRIRHFVGAHLVLWSSPLYYPLAAIIYVATATCIGCVMYYVLERPTIWFAGYVFSCSARSASPSSTSAKKLFSSPPHTDRAATSATPFHA